MAALSVIEPAPLLAYFEAWRSHSNKLIRRLFHPETEYEILGVGVLHGIEDIARYWTENAAVQRNVVCGARRIISTDRSIVAEWSASFLRVDKRQRYSLVGFLWMDHEDERITHFTEAYVKKVGEYGP